MVATTVKSLEMIVTRTQGQDRNRHPNQNRRLENERRNSVRASQNQNVRIPPRILHELLRNRGACAGGPRVEVEYENETEVAPRTRVVAGW